MLKGGLAALGGRARNELRGQPVQVYVCVCVCVCVCFWGGLILRENMSRLTALDCVSSDVT